MKPYINYKKLLTILIIINVIKNQNVFGKYNIKEKNFYITKFCDDNKSNNFLSYDLFYNMIESNKTNLIDFNIKKIK